MKPSAPCQRRFMPRLTTLMLVTLAMLLGLALPAHAQDSDLAVAFLPDTPTVYERGSNVSIPFQVQGDLPPSGDVLVLAWSDAKREMLGSFAHKLKHGPWQIESKHLDGLPLGGVELQLALRDRNRIRQIARHRIEVVDAGQTSRLGDTTQLSNQPAIEDPTQETSSTTTVPSPSFVNPPSEYVKASGQAIPFTLDAPLPANADVLILAWSNSERRMVDEFAHVLTQEPWQINASQLDQLPEGDTELQLMVRLGGAVQNKVTHWVDVLPPMPEVALVNPPATHQLGSTSTINYQVTGDLETGSTLSVSALQNGTVISAFTHDLPLPSGQITADRLNTLPVGATELRLSLVVPNRGTVTTSHSLTVAPRALPTASFTNPPAQYTLGSGQAIDFTLDGPLPDDGDVLVIAWSDSQRQMVDDFAHVLRQEPWQISAEKLDTLPAGRANLQLLTRGGGQVKKTDHWIEVVSPYPTLSFAATTPATYEKGSGRTVDVVVNGTMPADGAVRIAARDASGQVISTFTHTLQSAPWRISASKLDGLPTGTVSLRARLLLSGQLVGETAAKSIEVVEPIPDIVVSFPSTTPSSYQQGSGVSIPFNVSSIPPNGDVLVLAWSDAEQRMVSEFALTKSNSPWAIPAARMDMLPAGGVELQLLPRVDYVVTDKVVHRMTVLAASSGGNTGGSGGSGGTDGSTGGTDGSTGGSDGSTGGTDGGTGGSDGGTGGTDGGTGGSDGGIGGTTPGFTTFMKSTDTRVVYVSSSTGNDANDGLSPSTAVRTPERGYELMRNGYPDWLLFKRGDVFQLPTSGGVMRDWKKGGRSASEKMVIGAYGDVNRPRPRFDSNGGGGFKAGGSTLKHLALVDLHFHANRRNPKHADFNGGTGEEIGITWFPSGTDILIEGCRVDFFNMNVVWYSYDTTTNVTFRRTTLANAYSLKGQRHAHGGYFENIEGPLTFEQCILDHNGHMPGVPGSEATWFHHNIYLAQCNNIRVVDSISTRASLLGIKLAVNGAGSPPSKNVEIVGNVIARCGVAIATGGKDSNIYHDGGMIKGNLISHIGRNIWGFQISGGISLKHAKDFEVRANYLLDQPTEFNNEPALKVEPEARQNIILAGNTVHRWLYREPIRVPSDVTVTGNRVSQPDQYYVNASRSLETYAKSLGFSSLEAMLDRIAQQRRGNWDDRLTAPAILQYIKAGFAYVPAD